MSIGKKIKEARKKKGMTQVQLSDAARISRSYLGDLEGDRYNPSVDTLQKIAAVLGTTSGVLLGEANLAELVAVTTGNKVVMDYFEWERSKKPNDTYFTFPEDERRLLDLYRDLNAEGQEKLVDYADDLVTSGKYKKIDPLGVVHKK